MTIEDKNQEQSPKIQNNGNRQQQLDIPELAALGPDKKNWRGIGIALVVIMIVCALIVTAVLLLTPGDKGHPTGKEEITLKNVIDGNFSHRSFNGTWISDKEFLYRGPNGLEIYNVLNGTRQIVMPMSVFVDQTFYMYSLSPDRKYVLLATNYQKVYRYSYEGEFYIYDVSNEKLFPLVETKPDFQYAVWGPTNNQLAYVRRNNVYYMSSVDAAPRALSDTGIEGEIFNGIPDWVYEEELLLSNNAIWWSDDGTKLCYATFNDSGVDEMMYPYYGSFKDNSNVYPRIISLRYPKPGKKNPTVTLWVADLTSTNEPINVIPPSDYVNTDYYFTTAEWIDKNSLFVTWLKRAQNTSTFSVCKKEDNWACKENYRVDPLGHGWVDVYNSPTFTADKEYYFMILPGPPEGKAGPFKHLAMISLKDKDIKFLTRGKYEVTNILSYNPRSKTVYYKATLEDKPGERHLFSITDMTSDAPLQKVCFTCNVQPPCLYNSAKFSDSASYYVWECLGPDVPYVVLKETGSNKNIATLETNQKVRQLVKQKAMPQVKKLKVPLPGNYTARVNLLLPPKLREDEITKYPMLVQVYGGPGSQLVTESFSVSWGSYLASSRNIIFASIDGRGSGFQGQKMLWEVYRRLGTVEIHDQILVTKYLRDHLPYIDEEKISMFGWSYGGYATAMVMATDFEKIFSCGISVAPVTSWLYYDSAYTEHYMQLPTENDNLKAYEDSDVMSKVANFKGKHYFLIHGTGDDNVHWQQSAMLAKALTEAGILFRMQVYPDEAHALSNVKLHLYRVIDEFLNQCHHQEEFASDDT